MLLIVTAASTVLLALTAVDFVIGYWRIRSLADIAPASAGPSVTVIVAARNEALGVERGVRSLLRLDYPALEVVAVNDRSTDETGAILNRVAADDPRLRVVHVTELPSGWLGKNHALSVGAMKAAGDLLLFTDADVVLEPSTLRRAVALMARDRLDHLTAVPHATVSGFALNAFVAAFGVFFSVYSRPWKARDQRSRSHIGVGAFNLLRANVYHRIGTHQAIALRPDDDLKLGKLVKKHGFTQDVVIGRDFVVVEWYTSLGEMVNGLMKNAFAGVGYSVPMLIGATLGLVLTNVWPFAALIVTRGLTQLLAVVAAALVCLIFGMTVRAVGGRYVYVLVYPLAAILFAYVMWRSAWLALSTGHITWRDTAYSLAELRRNRV